MSAFALAPVAPEPFPHVQAERWLDDAVYESLKAAFPDCPAASGPTGYTLFRGDPDFDRLVAEHPGWGEFHARFHSQDFVDFALAQFADIFARECRVDLSRARYVPYVEDRIDKERGQLRRIEHAADALWVRVDIMQGRTGYARAAHLDHRRRAATLLLYFSDADADGMEGGDLLLHGPDGATDAIRPRDNRMVMFPCHNSSLHSVSPILRQRRPRNFVQVTLSSSVDLWEPLPLPLGARLRGLGRRALSALSARG